MRIGINPRGNISTVSFSYRCPLNGNRKTNCICVVHFALTLKMSVLLTPSAVHQYPGRSNGIPLRAEWVLLLVNETRLLVTVVS